MTSSVFVVGGGPSLRAFDWKQLDGRTVLAVNAAVLFLNRPALNSAAFVQDRRCLDRVVSDDRWPPFAGRTFWPLLQDDTTRRGPPPHVRRLDGVREWVRGEIVCEGHEQCELLDRRVLWSSHAGPAALNFARRYWPSCATFYLLGFDYDGTNFHDEYEKQGWKSDETPEQARERWAMWRGDLERAIARVREEGPRVVNLSPVSTIEGTEKMSAETVLRRIA